VKTVFFAKLIKFLLGIIIFWLILHFFQQLGRKKATTHRKKQGKNSHTNRKYVESHVVENSNQTNNETQS